MAGRRRAGASAQHHLIDHELPIVFADRAGGGTEARIGEIGAGAPFPDILTKALYEGSGVDRYARGPIFFGARLARRDFPFEFGRQPLAGPERESRCFIEADVTDGLGRFQRQPPIERIGAPNTVAFLPIGRSLPVFGVDLRPAVGKPERGGAIAAIFDEVEIFADADRPAGDAMIPNEGVMRRPLIVEGEAFTRMADGIDATLDLDPAAFRRFGIGIGERGGRIGRRQWILA